VLCFFCGRFPFSQAAAAAAEELATTVPDEDAIGAKPGSAGPHKEE
jgi:hypothetical protein